MNTKHNIAVPPPRTEIPFSATASPASTVPLMDYEDPRWLSPQLLPLQLKHPCSKLSTVWSVNVNFCDFFVVNIRATKRQHTFLNVLE